MKLVVLSDSHGQKAPLAYIRNKYKDVDHIIHCGDICLPKEYATNLEIVAGNCDNPAWYPNGKIIEIENHRILIIHGHVLFSSSFPNPEAVATVAKRNDCDIAFFGHSHIYYDGIIDGIHVCNPGSISSNRDGTPPCYMEVEINGKDFKATRVEYKPY